MQRYQATVLVNTPAMLGEGPLWDERAQRLLWLDILGKKLFSCNENGGALSVLPLPFITGTFALTEGKALLLAGERGIHFFQPETGRISAVADPEKTERRHRFNDGKCGPDGRFWAGGVRMQGANSAPPCALYKMDAGLRVEKVLSGIDVSNGLAWSMDGKTMYYIDSWRQAVWAFDYDAAAGALSNRRTVVSIDASEGEPDGMAIDTEGMLWVAIWRAGCVARFNPASGARLAQVNIDAPLASCPIFGGAGLGTLFITSASSEAFGQALQTANEGRLFAVNTGAKGLPTFRFPITDDALGHRSWEETR